MGSDPPLRSATPGLGAAWGAREAARTAPARGCPARSTDWAWPSLSAPADAPQSDQGQGEETSSAESVGRTRGRKGFRTAFAAGFCPFSQLPTGCRFGHQFAARVPCPRIPASMSFQIGFPGSSAPRLRIPEPYFRKSTHTFCRRAEKYGFLTPFPEFSPNFPGFDTFSRIRKNYMDLSLTFASQCATRGMLSGLVTRSESG